MRANQAVMQIHRRRLIHGAAASAAALTALTLLVTLYDRFRPYYDARRELERAAQAA